MIRLRPAVLGIVVAFVLSACSNPKSQHEQAVEWQQFYGLAAYQFQQDVRYTEAARAQYTQTPTDEALRTLRVVAGKVERDVATQPADVTQRSGPGAVGDAVQSLRTIEARISRAAADANDGDFTTATEQWNQAISMIWKAGSGDPAPTV